MLPGQLGQAPRRGLKGHLTSLHRSHHPRLREGCTPSAHTSGMGEQGSSRVPRPVAHCWGCRVWWGGCKQTQAGRGARPQERGQTQIKTRRAEPAVGKRGVVKAQACDSSKWKQPDRAGLRSITEPKIPSTPWLPGWNCIMEQGFKKPQVPAELTLQQLLRFQIVSQIKHRNAGGSQRWGKGEVTGVGLL